MTGGFLAQFVPTRGEIFFDAVAIRGPWTVSSFDCAMRDERSASASARPVNPVLWRGTKLVSVRPYIRKGHSQSMKSRLARAFRPLLCMGHAFVWRRYRIRATSSVCKLLYAASSVIRNLLILKYLAPRHGFEPRFTAPKAAVLPLDDRGLLQQRDTFSLSSPPRTRNAVLPPLYTAARIA